ncbi:hypothetical protein LTR62_003378 [Meristemomyces frigidus]|uniref:RRM domain-containing protein n=1 Tax=Meristemomyces frigidus TaxID=1508187 RepID=A0AAN7YKQ5_9PEZI|nr:hypothetical protein LTR62_003378 [Meristemomyces frigidus]
MAGGLRSNNAGGEYFFVIENLPRRYTWQDLKDLIRREASHGVWAEMAFYPNGQTGGKGHARVKRQDEARNLYRYLTTSVIEGRQVRVHLWDTSGLEQPDLLRCNCELPHMTQNNPAQSMEISQMALATGWVPATTVQHSPPTTNVTQYTTMAPVQYAPAPQVQVSMNSTQLTGAMANMSLGARDPGGRYATAHAQQQYNQLQQAQAGRSPSKGAYAMSVSSLPVNIRNGLVRTEVRGVFVSGLSYQARPNDVEALFEKAGEISRCDVQKDTSTGRSKGKATIKYTTAAGAAQAISLLDGRTYLGMKLKVRADTETTPVSAPPNPLASRSSQPVIVNGSQSEVLRKDSAFQEA